jgi:hypothetical protein
MGERHWPGPPLFVCCDSATHLPIRRPFDANLLARLPPPSTDQHHLSSLSLHSLLLRSFTTPASNQQSLCSTTLFYPLASLPAHPTMKVLQAAALFGGLASAVNPVVLRQGESICFRWPVVSLTLSQPSVAVCTTLLPLSSWSRPLTSRLRCVSMLRNARPVPRWSARRPPT